VPLQGQVRPWSLQRATAAAPSWSSAFDPQQRMACACVTPHVWALPAVNVLKRFPPDTGAGVTPRVVSSPRPSWPTEFPPQQYAAPLGVSPHVWSKLAASAVKVRPPVTATGVVLTTVSPMPRAPPGFQPQQYARPSRVSPQVCAHPATSDVNCSES